MSSMHQWHLLNVVCIVICLAVISHARVIVPSQGSQGSILHQEESPKELHSNDEGHPSEEEDVPNESEELTSHEKIVIDLFHHMQNFAAMFEAKNTTTTTSTTPSPPVFASLFLEDLMRDAIRKYHTSRRAAHFQNDSAVHKEEADETRPLVIDLNTSDNEEDNKSSETSIENHDSESGAEVRREENYAAHHDSEDSDDVDSGGEHPGGSTGGTVAKTSELSTTRQTQAAHVSDTWTSTAVVTSVETTEEQSTVGTTTGLVELGVTSSAVVKRTEGGTSRSTATEEDSLSVLNSEASTEALNNVSALESKPAQLSALTVEHDQWDHPIVSKASLFRQTMQVSAILAGILLVSTVLVYLGMLTWRRRAGRNAVGGGGPSKSIKGRFPIMDYVVFWKRSGTRQRLVSENDDMKMYEL